MSKYGDIYYGLPSSIYGERARIAYSAEPFVASAIDYSQVKLTWTAISDGGGDPYVSVRLVRNQYAYSETSDDGVILVEATENFPLEFTDDEGLGSGRYAFYTLWVKLLNDGIWILAGKTHTLIPSAHTSNLPANFVDEDGVTKITPETSLVLMSTHDKLMSYLPRVMASGGGVTDLYDPTSTLSKFLEGFSFTMDEFLTYTDLIVPGISGKYSNPGLLDLQSLQLGLQLDPEGLTKTQKQLVRSSIYNYGRKGTINGLENWSRCVTGYESLVTVGSNLLLSIQDSSFIGGVGFWQGVDGAELTADTTEQVSGLDSSADFVVDTLWSAKVVATTSGSLTPAIQLGFNDPIRTGIPVIPGVEYTFSYGVKSASSGSEISSVFINWFNIHGELVSDGQTASTVSVSSTFVRKTYTQTAPDNAAFAAIRISFVGTGGKTYYLARAQFAESSVLNFSDSRAVFLNLLPKRVNFLKNPAFVDEEDGGAPLETNLEDTISFVENTVPDAKSGDTALQIVTDSATSSESSPTLGFTAEMSGYLEGQTYQLSEEFYTLSFYAKSDEDIYLSVKLYADDEEVVLSTTETIDITDVWKRFQVTLKLDDTLILNEAVLKASVFGNTGAGTEIQFAYAQLESGYSATNYFDGSITKAGAGWMDGPTAANDSISYLYPNRLSKILRLNSEIQDYLPINRAYFVISAIGVEKLGIS